MKRRLVLHTGSTKSGSSAIQVGLAQNYEALRAQGVLVPQDKHFEKQFDGQVSGGNASPLKLFGRSLQKGAVPSKVDPEKRLKLWLNKTFKGDGMDDIHTVVLSGEAIPDWYDENGFVRLREIASAYFDEISILYYVRHLTDHAVSQYGEYVRRRRMKASFTEFAPNYVAPFMRAITRMEGGFGRENVQVRLFDAERAMLWPGFARAIGGDPAHLRTPKEVNRSLCAEEIALFRDLNSLDLDRFLVVKTASLYCAALPPATKNRIVPTSSDVEVITENHMAQMAFVSERLSDGLKLLPISDPLRAQIGSQTVQMAETIPFSHMRQLLISALTAQKMRAAEDGDAA